MKGEIETKHFEHFAVLGGTNRAAEPRLTKTGRGVCVVRFTTTSPPWVLSCDECSVSVHFFLTAFLFFKVTKHERLRIIL